MSVPKKKKSPQRITPETFFHYMAVCAVLQEYVRLQTLIREGQGTEEDVKEVGRLKMRYWWWTGDNQRDKYANWKAEKREGDEDCEDDNEV